MQLVEYLEEELLAFAHSEADFLQSKLLMV